jgi:chemotaxis protein methyltransferase CheR
VWSAACSTGEEPYTIAMLLAERGLLDRVEIVATDVSATTIARARAGRHGTRSLRDGYPTEIARRYLDATTHGVVVSEAIRDAVAFAVVNLVDERACAALGMFDAIVCRNVLIYFDDAQVARVIDRVARQLVPDGLLAVGVSESLLRFGTQLVCDERGSAFFYRRAP